MNWVDILVVVALGLLVLAFVLYVGLKKAKGQRIGGCDCGGGAGRRIVKEFHKEKAKAAEKEGHCPHCRP
jgi:hypothetical protein